MNIKVEESEGLRLYKKWGKTDPSITKKVTYGKRSFTTIDAYHQVLLMTEEFGPMGKWGFKDIDLKVEERIATFKGTFFYPAGSFVIVNSISTYMKDKIDPDFAKKLMTDSLTKAFSYLLMNADVFLGRFDDARYVNEREQEIKEKENKDVSVLRDKAADILVVKADNGLVDADAFDRYKNRLELIDNVAEMERAIRVLNGIQAKAD
jgi:hypothetical protein